MRLAACCGLILTCGAAISAPAGAQQELIYATVGGRALAVDLYLPEGAAKPPLVIWVLQS